MALLALFALPHGENLISKDWHATVIITAQIDGVSEKEICESLTALDVKVKSIGLHYQLKENQKTMRCELKFKKADLTETPRIIVQ